MSRLFINRWLFLSFAFVFSFSYAASSSYTVQGNVYRVVEFVSSDSNEIKLSTVVKGAAANEPYAARVVALRQSRFASWFKPNLGSLIKANLWWMGFAAVIESAGWAIDELKGQVVQQAPGVVPGYYFVIVFATGNVYGSTPSEACKNFHPSTPNGDKNTVEGNLCALRDPVTGDRIGRWEISMSKCPSPQPGLASCNGTPVTEPVSDADLQAAINAQLAADPAHAATAFTDPATGRGYDELFDPVPYIPGLSAADEALVNCYISGQLQMVNSQTACYVATQAEYDRVKQQADALAAGKTPDATADALNSQMKQPITQAQYEESNRKAETDQAASLATSLAPALDPFNQLKIDSDFVLDKVTNPSEPPSSLSFFTWSLPTGSCAGFNVDFSVGNGKLHTSKRVNEFCDFYSTVAHPLLFWFLNILTFLYVWWVWDRSVSDMAR